MDIISGNYRNRQFFAEFINMIINQLLMRQMRMMLNFQIKIISAEQIPITPNHLPRRIQIIIDNIGRQLAGQASSQANQPLMMLGQQFPINSRPIIKTGQMSNSGQFNQIPITLFILSQ